MAQFDTALPIILQYEGGYVNDPQDSGGETYKGISRKMNPQWSGWTVVDTEKKQAGFPLSLDKNPTLQQSVASFYKTNYWDKIQGDQMQNQNVATSIFDFAVNAGVTTSIKLAQQTVKVNNDGILGNISLSTINQTDPNLFVALFTIEKVKYYIQITNRNPDNRKFFFGWVNRAVNG